MKRQALVIRWAVCLRRLRPELINAIENNKLDRAETLLARVNTVCRHQRAANIRNGLNAAPWIDASLDSVVQTVRIKGAK